MRGLALSLAAAGVVLAACSSSPANQPPRTPGTADPSRGRELFIQRGCGTCHALQAAGTTGTVGPNLNGIGSRAGERKPGMSAEEYLRESIVNPNAYVVEGYSPAMPINLITSQQDMDDLVAFLLAQR